jgi:peptide deformylase
VGSGRPSDRLRAIGIRQQGDPVLRAPCARFELPAEADQARRLRAELLHRMRLIHGIHPFVKGMGLAAPQIGVPRALAVVEPPAGEPITLLNPQVVNESADRDQQYEGCLSFFDVRGLVGRPLSIRVRCAAWDGGERLFTFDRGVARLAAHEIDHLEGRLYLDRLAPATRPVPLAEYEGTGAAWLYEAGEPDLTRHDRTSRPEDR